jgi:hypothetical protein
LSPRSPDPHHLVLRLLQGHPARADLSVQAELLAVLDRRLRPGLEPQIVRRRGVSAEPQRNQVIELVVVGRVGKPLRQLVL